MLRASRCAHHPTSISFTLRAPIARFPRGRRSGRALFVPGLRCPPPALANNGSSLTGIRPPGQQPRLAQPIRGAPRDACPSTERVHPGHPSAECAQPRRPSTERAHPGRPSAERAHPGRPSAERTHPGRSASTQVARRPGVLALHRPIEAGRGQGPRLAPMVIESTPGSHETQPAPSGRFSWLRRALSPALRASSTDGRSPPAPGPVQRDGQSVLGRRSAPARRVRLDRRAVSSVLGQLWGPAWPGGLEGAGAGQIQRLPSHMRTDQSS